MDTVCNYCEDCFKHKPVGETCACQKQKDMCPFCYGQNTDMCELCSFKLDMTGEEEKKKVKKVKKQKDIRNFFSGMVVSN